MSARNAKIAQATIDAFARYEAARKSVGAAPFMTQPTPPTQEERDARRAEFEALKEEERRRLFMFIGSFENCLFEAGVHPGSEGQPS